MKALKLAVILLTISISANAQDENIQVIRTHFKYVTENIDSFEQTHIDLMDFSTEGGELVKYFDDNTLVLMTAAFYGETGKREIDYYVKNGNLIFVFDKEYNYNMPIFMDSLQASQSGLEDFFDPTKTKIYENRYYYSEGLLMRWINQEGVFVDPKDSKYKEKQSINLLDFIEYKTINN